MPQQLPAPFSLNQNYVLFRYLQLIQSNGTTAIHFNGGIIDWGATGDPGTPSNVHDHATKIQGKYGHVGCIVFVAKEKTYYPPKNSGRQMVKFDKTKTIGEAIQHADDDGSIDDHVRCRGLDAGGQSYD